MDWVLGDDVDRQSRSLAWLGRAEPRGHWIFSVIFFVSVVLIYLLSLIPSSSLFDSLIFSLWFHLSSLCGFVYLPSVVPS